MDMLLNGKWLDLPYRMEVRDPQDGSLVDTVPKSDPEDMRAAVDAAAVGLQRARAMPKHQRVTVLRQAADAVAARHEEFSRTISREGVKTIREARKEVARCVDTLRISAEEARRLGGETIPFDQAPGGEGRFGYYTREPVGIVGAITPFNDPLNLVAHKVGPALAAGNAVIVKPHEATPLSALLLARVIHEAGLPPGVLQVVTGTGDVGGALVADPRVRVVSFTGGRKTGEEILRRAGLKKVIMELESISPVIVMPDADLDRAVEATASGAFWAAGQNCLHVQRLFVHEAVYSEFAARLADIARSLNVGDKQDETTDMGPLIDENAAQRVERLVDAAVSAGARLLVGGNRTGAYYDPTLLERVPETCTLATEEVFGPVTILSPVSTLDEAVRQANAVDYGLQAGIFTRDLATAFKAVADLACGGVMVNDSSDYRIDAMPFGGIKGSGLGREGVRFALHEMTELKVACFSP
jgi:glyceraldehyde-3-phosphate dehydrogenase (NADP+)